jgi:uncharacterized protein (TIGR02246 family)
VTDASQDEAAILELFDRQTTAWERADAELFASAFAEHADFINITATPLRGRREIAEHHKKLWATIYKGSAITGGPTRVRFIRPDVALVESEASLKFGEEERHAHALAVAVRNGDRWEIAALHNMLPLRPPPAP